MYDDIRPMFPHDCDHSIQVRDFTLHKTVTRIRFEVLDRLQVPRIGKLVEVDYLRFRVRQKVPDQIAPDESRTAGHQNPIQASGLYHIRCPGFLGVSPEKEPLLSTSNAVWDRPYPTSGCDLSPSRTGLSRPRIAGRRSDASNRIPTKEFRRSTRISSSEVR